MTKKGRNWHKVLKTEYFNSPLFLIGLVVKVLCAIFLTGELFRNSFIPFIDYFVESGLSSPYSHYLSAEPDAFPYPAFMLYIFAIPRAIFGDIEALNLFIHRIPLLLADIMVYLTLLKLNKGKQHQILLLYWCSPVLLYISYIHGQFDLIPIMFLIGSIYFVFRQKTNSASIAIGLALAAKTHILLVIPLYLVYLGRQYKEKRIEKLAIAVGLIFGTFLVLNLPYIANSDFLAMVFQNKEQGKLWSFGIDYGGSIIFYVIPAIYVFLFAKFYNLRHIGKDAYVMYTGFVFCLLILFIAPKPGWYFWVVPFLVYFYIKENKLTVVPLLLLQLSYLLYFGFVADSDYLQLLPPGGSNNSLYAIISDLNINPNRVVNLLFTVLQTFLIVNIYWIYKSGVSKNLKMKIKSKPLLIGIGGDSGVGKSTLTNSLELLFSPQNLTVIRGDDMHKWERGHEMWQEHTHLAPEANNLYQEITSLKALKNGERIIRKLYNHNTGEFDDPVPVHPNNVIVSEGLHPFYISAKRDLFDVKIFMNPEPSLRFHWKINRDIKKRNYSKEKVLEQLEFRRSDSEKYIQSQAQYADIEIIFFPTEKIKNIGDRSEAPIALKVKFDTAIDIEAFSVAMGKISSLKMNHSYEISSQSFVVSGEISADLIYSLAYELIDDAEQILDNPSFQSGYNGILQLFILFFINSKINSED